MAPVHLIHHGKRQQRLEAKLLGLLHGSNVRELIGLTLSQQATNRQNLARFGILPGDEE